MNATKRRNLSVARFPSPHKSNHRLMLQQIRDSVPFPFYAFLVFLFTFTFHLQLSSVYFSFKIQACYEIHTCSACGMSWRRVTRASGLRSARSTSLACTCAQRAFRSQRVFRGKRHREEKQVRRSWSRRRRRRSTTDGRRKKSGTILKKGKRERENKKQKVAQ